MAMPVYGGVIQPPVQLRIVGFGVVEQGHDIAAVPVASLVFAAREDAELLARLVRAHSLPVEGELRDICTGIQKYLYIWTDLPR